MIILYQMPISHFCEKSRWALAYKRLPHKYKNLLPGLHIKKAKKMAEKSSLPILKEGKIFVQGSSNIIDYLDAEFPRFPLTPDSVEDAKKAKEWEAWADAEIGPAVRMLAYSTLLSRADILIPVMAQDGPWYKNLYMNKAFPKIKHALEQGLNITEERVLEAKATLHAAINHIQSAQPENEPLLSSGFSRADIAVASLLAPLFTPSKFGVLWPETMPLEFQRISEEFNSIRPWVESMYQRYR